MEFSIRKVDVTDSDLWRKNQRQRKSADTADQEFETLEDFDSISLNNKEANKQNLQLTAELISLAQNNESNIFQKAYGEYLGNKLDNTQDKKTNETLELIKVFLNLGSKALANALENLGSKISDIFDEDLLLRISSGIVNIGSVCNSVCETIINPSESRVMCPEISFQ